MTESQSFSTLQLLTFGARSFWVVDGCPVCYRIGSGTLGFYPLDALSPSLQVVTTKRVPRRCQMSPRVTNYFSFKISPNSNLCFIF